MKTRQIRTQTRTQTLDVLAPLSHIADIVTIIHIEKTAVQVVEAQGSVRETVVEVWSISWRIHRVTKGMRMRLCRVGRRRVKEGLESNVSLLLQLCLNLSWIE